MVLAGLVGAWIPGGRFSRSLQVNADIQLPLPVLDGGAPKEPTSSRYYLIRLPGRRPSSSNGQWCAFTQRA